MTEETAYTIRPEFAVHALNQDGTERVADVAKMLSVCLTNIECITGSEGRDMAIVRTKLQEAKAFAIAAIVAKSENLL